MGAFWVGDYLSTAHLRQLGLCLLELLGQGLRLLAQALRLTRMGEVQEHQDRHADDGGKPGIRPRRRDQAMERQRERHEPHLREST